MRKNTVKDKLRNKQPSYGIGLLWPSPELVELSGYLGFDWLWLDVEHGAFDLQELSHVARAAEAAGIVPIARVPKTRDPEQLLGIMETGMMGIITSHVQTKEDVSSRSGRSSIRRWGRGAPA